MSNQLKAFAERHGIALQDHDARGNTVSTDLPVAKGGIYYGRADEVTIEGAKTESQMRVLVRAILTRHLKRQFSLALPTVAPSERAVPGTSYIHGAFP